MSGTLFRYIFKDLLRIFLMTSGALAGIMSFGGLLRPLTEHGLDATQVAMVLTYFMPAMMTYSLPIAALFATTMVYGRIAADNELTACRAAGIPFFSLLNFSLMLPAIVLGLLVAIISLVFLCFVVPNFSLKVEKVLYSNLAQLVATEIERNRQIRFENQTIYAERAIVTPATKENPNEQIVTLEGVTVTTYGKPTKKDPKLSIPSDFYLARTATIFINRAGENDDEYSIDITLDGGTMFPREFTSPFQGGVNQTHFGPILRPSPVGEDPKFMDIRRLHELSSDELKSRRIRDILRGMRRDDQSAQFLREVRDDLNGRNGIFRFDAGNEVFDLRRAGGEAYVKSGELILPNGRLIEERGGDVTLTADAEEIRMRVVPTMDEQFSVTIMPFRARIQQGNETTERGEGFTRTFRIAMPGNIKSIEDRGPKYYLQNPEVPRDMRNYLARELVQVRNGIESELHSRASFALSCLFLVVIGSVLGMMFRSGNFLTAFAISVAPALLCIALIVVGQHTAGNVGWKMENFRDPLALGLTLIWGGNIAVFTIACVLMWRLQRQ